MRKSRLVNSFKTFFALVGMLVVAGLLYVYITNAAGISTLISVLGLVKSQALYEVNNSQLIQGATAGIVDSMQDPYSKYLDKQTWKDLRERLEAEFGGIGVYVLQDNEGRLKIVSPIKDTPAYREGVKHGDIILRINNKSALNMSTDDAVHLMRGDPGTQLLLGVYRESDKKEYDFRIIREIINVPSVEDKIISEKPRIGYIGLNQFHSRSAEEMKESIDELLEEKKVEGLILDLRNNGGGDFDASIAIASIFLDGQEVVSVVDRKGNKTVHKAGHGKLDIPLVVMVNGDSASASEILAGALQDNKRALLVGDKTYGKGLVQTVYPLGNGGALKLTTQKYFTPDGTDINEIGITPDFPVKNEANSEEDRQLQKALEIVKKQIAGPVSKAS
ncbi:S41 family peptidase [Syntrophomonas wolfei]|uniref:C-terminal processing peptidase-2. Serine peptidase. MEROPS family S41A n=1 Tax=Syntrophomonas wolfei subsp. wolfei (strain DSM 2245B / Goettingen) TaxID=335541 RepID=Q0B0A5_SYNWW|nr:S41 family peptidase [Syntrophomonas wolfei]ABI67599.1 C-terminal processing peptidase-2. Serine peptidase. MEROPS family S41A [Syntrophomonas wolfei subsp. wolfei str. Goettingen G311]